MQIQSVFLQVPIPSHPITEKCRLEHNTEDTSKIIQQIIPQTKRFSMFTALWAANLLRQVIQKGNIPQ